MRYYFAKQKESSCFGNNHEFRTGLQPAVVRWQSAGLFASDACICQWEIPLRFASLRATFSAILSLFYSPSAACGALLCQSKLGLQDGDAACSLSPLSRRLEKNGSNQTQSTKTIIESHQANLLRESPLPIDLS